MLARSICALIFAALAALVSAAPSSPAESPCASVLDHKFLNLQDEQVTLCQFSGKVLLIVNTASECGYTPQYEGLEKVYRRYRDKGFVILGFPANDFGGQEPGSNKEIAQFCRLNYGVTFPMFSKRPSWVRMQTRSIAPSPRRPGNRRVGISTSISSTGQGKRWRCSKVPSNPRIRGLLRRSRNYSPRADSRSKNPEGAP